MCTLFGIINYKHLVSKKNLKVLVNRLAVASEVRGTDASGIAYVKNGRLVIYKKPLPAHKIRFCVPSDTTIVMGHTRMTTQGAAKFNYNNHPFMGRTEEGSFALCHNGMLYNDRELAISEELPATSIQTDSYMAVQLIEKQGVLDFDSIAGMSEKVSGSFVFTILGDDNTLYIAKGDNPICLLYFKELGLYVYASTPNIMKEALIGSFLEEYDFEEIKVNEGDIVSINRDGILEKSRFTLCDWFGYRTGTYIGGDFDIPYEDLELLYDMGYCDDDIELLANDRELLRYCIDEARVMMGEYVGG